MESYKLVAKKSGSLSKWLEVPVSKSVKEDDFQIGRRNLLMLRKLLWKNGVVIKAEDVGDQIAHTMALVIADGEVLIHKNGSDNKL